MLIVHLMIEGKVQGVFYRASAKKMADELGICGWVRNADEGHVEILAKGNYKEVTAYIDWCKQGPPRAVVSNLIVTEKDDSEIFEGFEIVR